MFYSEKNRHPQIGLLYKAVLTKNIAGLQANNPKYLIILNKKELNMLVHDFS